MTNCYIVTDETTLECAVIDPGDESNTILYYLGGQPPHLPRHPAHARPLDHTGAVYAVHEENGARPRTHERRDDARHSRRRIDSFVTPPEGNPTF